VLCKIVVPASILMHLQLVQIPFINGLCKDLITNFWFTKELFREIALFPFCHDNFCIKVLIVNEVLAKAVLHQ